MHLPEFGRAATDNAVLIVAPFPMFDPEYKVEISAISQGCSTHASDCFITVCCVRFCATCCYNGSGLELDDLPAGHKLLRAQRSYRNERQRKRDGADLRIYACVTKKQDGLLLVRNSGKNFGQTRLHRRVQVHPARTLKPQPDNGAARLPPCFG